MRAALAILLVAGCSFEVPAPYAGDGGAGGSGGSGGPGGSTGSPATTTSSSTTSTGAACVAPEASCPNEEGCFEILSDPDHCGATCEPCLPGGSCLDGFCGCLPMQIECNNPPGCYDPDTSASHCGDCNTACSPTEECSDGHCCPAGNLYCLAPTPGCYPVQTDEQHCGSCDEVCGADEVCTSGTCVCAAGTHDCPLEMGCFPDDDVTHCGPTCQACGANEACVAGACQCAVGFTDCNGTCLALDSDPSNCGACEKECSTPGFPGATCSSGHCQKAPTNAGVGVTRGLAVDASTSPSTLYSISVDSKLWRFGDAIMPADSVTQPLNAVLGRLHMTASGGVLSYGFSVQTSGALYSGQWGALSDAVSSSVGFTSVAHVGSTLYWGTNQCVRTNPASPVDVVCFGSEYPTTLLPHPSDATDAFVHPISTSGTQGHIRRIDLGGGGVLATYTTFPIAQRTEDSLSSFATDENGATLYYFGLGAGPGDIELRRYDIAGGSSQALMAYSGSAIPVAVLRDGTSIYWVWRDGSTVEIRRATTVALNAVVSPNPVPAVDELLSSFTVDTSALPAIADVEQDAEALYFVADTTVYRLAK